MAVNVATKQHQQLDPYQDIEAYLARAQKEIGDAFDDIVMVASKEVQGGGSQRENYHHGRAAINSNGNGLANKNNNANYQIPVQKKIDENSNLHDINWDKYSTYEINKQDDKIKRAYVSQTREGSMYPPSPPPRFQSLMLDNRIKRCREELLQSKTNRKPFPRSFRNMSCPARQRFLDDLTNSLIKNNRTMSLSDSEEPDIWWRTRRRSSLPSPSDEFPFERCNDLRGRLLSGSLDRPIVRKRVILNGQCFDEYSDELVNGKNHSSPLEDVKNKHIITGQKINKQIPELKTLSNKVDFDEIAAFVDSVVEEVNSLSVDEELNESAKENLAKLASYFPKAKLRAKQVSNQSTKYNERMYESEPDYESIDDVNDDVFEDDSENLSINEKLGNANDVIIDEHSSPSSSLTSPSNKLSEGSSSELVNNVFEHCINEANLEEMFASIEDECKSEDFDQFLSLTDSGEFRKSDGNMLKDVECLNEEKSIVNQKKCDLGEFLKQVESSIRETNGTTSPSFLSAESDIISIEDLSLSILVDATTQTTPPSLSRSTSFTWFCDCQCNGQDCKHRQSVIWEEDSRDMLDASVNDMLSAIGDTPASVEELMKLDVLKELSTNDCEDESSSSSYSLSASLDNVSAGHISSEEEDESVSLTSTFNSNSPTEEEGNRDSKLDFAKKLSKEIDDQCFKLSSKGKYGHGKNGKCFKGVDVGTSPFNTLAFPKPNSAKTTTCLKNACPKSKDLIAEGRLSHSLDQMTNQRVNADNGGDESSDFSTVSLPKPRVCSTTCGNHLNFSGEVKSDESVSQVSRAENGCLTAVLNSQCDWLNCNKSFSAPILGCPTQFTNVSDHSSNEGIERTSPNEAEEIKELEAVEACKWLRAAGFPQYAQMFEDMQFPIDVSAVQKDHYFLDHDSLQSLFRRLNALNRCARMRLDNLPRKINGDDSDEENQCALSENWKFQRQSRRWSRIPGNFEAVVSRRNSNKDEWYTINDNSMGTELEENSNINEMDSLGNKFHLPVLEVAISSDVPIPMDEDGGSSSASPPASEKCENSSPLKRSGSERIKDGAKALLRRVESLKSRRSKRKNREVVVISGPQLLDVPGKDDGESFTCLQVTPPDTPALRLYTSPSAGESSSPSPNSPLDQASPSITTTTKIGRKKGRRFFGGGRYRGDDSCALSDSECSPTLWRSGPPSPTAVNKCYIENFLAPDSPQHLGTEHCDGLGSNGINYRTGSFNLGVDSNTYRERFKEPHKSNRGNKRDSSDLEQDRQSVYDNVPVVIFNRGYADDTLKPVYQSLPNSSVLSGEHKGDDSSINEVDSGSATSTVHDTSDREGRSPTQSHLERRDSGVGLSLTRSDRSQSIWQTSVKCHRPSIPCRSVPLNELSSGQIMVIRKLALLKLTALMERYSPSNRSGWNWAMPKFIKRMKTPEYKDKMVFGVPLVVVLQRTGQPLPPSIQTSIRYIRKSAIDSVGIFRKSGVRSRIQKLKNLHEINPANVVYDDLQPYDVADLLKQYFRELPEALLTNKMSETFISIYQHVAEEARLEALQAAVVLLPDENREVLQALLCFLNDVANRSNENQMTASNLAVCFAPSLFHMNCPRSQSTSPRRRKTVGVPDQRELSENRAAHECLTQMICDFNLLFSIPDDILAQVRCPYMDQWQPPTMEQVLLVGGNDNWKVSVESDIQWLLKESKDKFKSWVQISTNDGTDLAYKKVGDGNPLRIWKVAVEIEAPPAELLNSLLRERHLWDSDILKWRVIERLNKQTEVFQYVYNSMSPLPARDYCILRSWRTDLPKGTCILIESSVDHPDASTLLGGVRGVVLVSRYLIEPCGSGKSRLTHVSRVDTRGRSPEWYNKVYGHVSCCHVTRLRDSLHHSTDGPESKV